MLAFAFAAAVSAQTLLQNSVTSGDPMFGPDPAAPVAAPGLWAVSTPGCGGPLTADLAGWPECARPVRIEGDVAALMAAARDPGAPPLRALSTRFTLAPAWPGSPAVMQLEIPGLLDTAFVYGALQPGAADGQGRFTAARLWPVACPGPGVAGVGEARAGCRVGTPTGVHEAARRAAPEPVLALRWIAP